MFRKPDYVTEVRYSRDGVYATVKEHPSWLMRLLGFVPCFSEYFVPDDDGECVYYSGLGLEPESRRTSRKLRYLLACYYAAHYESASVMPERVVDEGARDANLDFIVRHCGDTGWLPIIQSGDGDILYRGSHQRTLKRAQDQLHMISVTPSLIDEILQGSVSGKSDAMDSPVKITLTPEARDGLEYFFGFDHPLTKRVPIGSDGRCQCDCATKCPLGRTGSSVRCTAEQLEAAGYAVERV